MLMWVLNLIGLANAHRKYTRKMSDRCELRLLASHPVQYQVPYYRLLAEAGVALEVGFYHQGTAGRSGYDEEFGIAFAWDLDLLTGYRHRVFLDEPAQYSLREQARVSVR